jgi:hypothetical protein
MQWYLRLDILEAETRHDVTRFQTEWSGNEAGMGNPRLGPAQQASSKAHQRKKPT